MRYKSICLSIYMYSCKNDKQYAYEIKFCISMKGDK